MQIPIRDLYFPYPFSQAFPVILYFEFFNIVNWNFRYGFPPNVGLPERLVAARKKAGSTRFVAVSGRWCSGERLRSEAEAPQAGVCFLQPPCA
jgi:hypothetical protein